MYEAPRGLNLGISYSLSLTPRIFQNQSTLLTSLGFNLGIAVAYVYTISKE